MATLLERVRALSDRLGARDAETVVLAIAKHRGYVSWTEALWALRAVRGPTNPTMLALAVKKLKERGLLEVRGSPETPVYLPAGELPLDLEDGLRELGGDILSVAAASRYLDEAERLLGRARELLDEDLADACLHGWRAAEKAVWALSALYLGERLPASEAVEKLYRHGVDVGAEYGVAKALEQNAREQIVGRATVESWLDTVERLVARARTAVDEVVGRNG